MSSGTAGDQLTDRHIMPTTPAGTTPADAAPHTDPLTHTEKVAELRKQHAYLAAAVPTFMRRTIVASPVRPVVRPPVTIAAAPPPPRPVLVRGPVARHRPPPRTDDDGPAAPIERPPLYELLAALLVSLAQGRWIPCPGHRGRVFRLLEYVTVGPHVAWCVACADDGRAWHKPSRRARSAGATS